MATNQDKRDDDEDESEPPRRLQPATVTPRVGPADFRTGHSDLEIAEDIDRSRPRLQAPRQVPVEESEETGRLRPAGEDATPSIDTGRLPQLTHAERQRLPTISPGVAPGSSEMYENQVARLEDQKQNPWGSPENHPGRLGKISHVAARIGNIAGDVLAPGITALVPGSDLNRSLEESSAERKLGQAQTREGENRLRRAQVENLESEAEKRPNPENEWETITGAQNAQGQMLERNKGTGEVRPIAGATAVLRDENKQPIGDTGATQHGKELETLTGGMPAEEKKKFLDAFSAGANDTHAVATKRLEDAKAAAQLAGGERDRALQRSIAERNHEDAQANKKTEMSSEIVRVVDKQNHVHLIPRDEYEAHKDDYPGHPMKQNPDAIKEATNHATAINEMQARTNAMVDAVRNFNWTDSGQKSIVKQALAHSNDHAFVDGILGIPITQWTAANVKQWGLEGATPETRDYIVAALSMREAALGMPKEITGGSRQTEIATNALWNTLPEGATPNNEWAMKQLQTFQSIIDRLKHSRVPVVPGLPEEPKNPSLMQYHYAGKSGEIFSDDGQHWVDAKGNPVGR